MYPACTQSSEGSPPTTIPKPLLNLGQTIGSPAQTHAHQQGLIDPKGEEGM